MISSDGNSVKNVNLSNTEVIANAIEAVSGVSASPKNTLLKNLENASQFSDCEQTLYPAKLRAKKKKRKAKTKEFEEFYIPNYDTLDAKSQECAKKIKTSERIVEEKSSQSLDQTRLFNLNNVAPHSDITVSIPPQSVSPKTIKLDGQNKFPKDFLSVESPKTIHDQKNFLLSEKNQDCPLSQQNSSPNKNKVNCVSQKFCTRTGKKQDYASSQKNSSPNRNNVNFNGQENFTPTEKNQDNASSQQNSNSNKNEIHSEGQTSAQQSPTQDNVKRVSFVLTPNDKYIESTSTQQKHLNSAILRNLLSMSDRKNKSKKTLQKKEVLQNFLSNIVQSTRSLKKKHPASHQNVKSIIDSAKSPVSILESQPKSQKNNVIASKTNIIDNFQKYRSFTEVNSSDNKSTFFGEKHNGQCLSSPVSQNSDLEEDNYNSAFNFNDHSIPRNSDEKTPGFGLKNTDAKISKKNHSTTLSPKKSQNGSKNLQTNDCDSINPGQCIEQAGFSTKDSILKSSRKQDTLGDEYTNQNLRNENDLEDAFKAPNRPVVSPLKQKISANNTSSQIKKPYSDQLSPKKPIQNPPRSPEKTQTRVGLRTVKITNLPSNSNNENIRELFKKYGKIESINFKSHKNTALVRFHLIFGNKLFTEKVYADKEQLLTVTEIVTNKTQQNTLKKSTVCIHNIDKKLTVKNLKKIFKKHKRHILNIQIQTNRCLNLGFCILLFKSREGSNEFCKKFGRMIHQLGGGASLKPGCKTHRFLS